MSSHSASQKRRDTYFRLSSRLARHETASLLALLGDTPSQAGWGRHQCVEIDQRKVFVKRVPLTDREYDHLFSTQNLYDLPAHYNYGVGSAGFGAFRELVTHLKTTHWVLSGDIETFPLLYHFRILPFSGERAAVDLARHQEYVAYWGGNENISRYLLDRASASHEIVLFLEYFPHVLQPWLREHPDEIDWVLDDLRATVDFLREKNIVHFDAHFHNILTDGRRAYLTDFGLALDKSFDLSGPERALFQASTYYDYGEILSCLGSFLHRAFDALTESEQRQLREKYGVPEGSSDQTMLAVGLANLETLQADGHLNVNAKMLACLVRYRAVIILMHDFYSEMRRNPRKDTPFPRTPLRRLLKQTGFVS